MTAARGIPFLDHDRPRAESHPGIVLSPAGRAAQQTLRGIHDHLDYEERELLPVLGRLELLV